MHQAKLLLCTEPRTFSAQAHMCQLSKELVTSLGTSNKSTRAQYMLCGCNVLKACVSAAAGMVQYVYAVRDIKKGDELCVHYTSLYEPRRVRQQALLQDKFFSCACERCSVPLEQSVDRFLEVPTKSHPV